MRPVRNVARAAAGAGAVAIAADAPPADETSTTSPPLADVLLPLALGTLVGGPIGARGDAVACAATVAAASIVVVVAAVVAATRARRMLVVVAAAMVAAMAGSVARTGDLPPDHVGRAVGSRGVAPIAVEGAITASRPRGDGRSLTVAAERIRVAGEDRAATGLVGVTIAHPRQTWPVGSRVRLVARLRRPRNFGNPGGYDVERALARRGIHATTFLWDDEAITLVAAPRDDLSSRIAAFRERIVARVSANVAAPERGFVVAVLSGVDAVDDDTRRVLARTGLAHATSVSGFHIAVVAGAAVLLAGACLRRCDAVLLRWDRWKIAGVAGLAPVAAYAAIAGGSVPALRSVLMYLAVLGALAGERPPDAMRALAAAALVLGLAVPDVVGDISFQLSFVSVAALILVARRTRRDTGLAENNGRLRRAIRTWVVEPMIVSAAASIATAPLTAWHFQQVSLIAPVANLLALPLLGPLTLLPGLAALPILTVAPATADALLAVAGLAARAGLAVATACARVPYAALTTPMPSVLELCVCYAWLLLPVAARAASVSRRAVRLAPAVAVLVAVSIGDVGYWVWVRTLDPRLRATFLSVGQGDGAVVELPRGGVIVVDGGGFAGGFDTGERLIAPFLHARKVLRLEAIVMSHPQLDHYGGLAALAEQFAPREFWSNGTIANAPGFARLERALDAAGTRRRVLARGDVPVARGDVAIEVAHPARTAGVDPNNASLVVRLVHGDVRFLFTGDVEAPAEAEMLAAAAPLATTVLKVAHHGSATSSTARFLAAAAPRVAIISDGVDNRFGFPAPAVLARLDAIHAHVWRTDTDGAIAVTSNGDTITVATHARRGP